MAPHLYAKGMTPEVQRHYTAQAERGMVNAAVAISLSGGVYVGEYTGTRHPGCPVIPKYVNAKGKVMAGMGAEEYTHFLAAAWEYFKEQRAFRRYARSAMLVHDRNTVHKSTVVSKWLEKHQIQSSLAPPRSPDLMPLDYGVFGTVKQELSRAQGYSVAWEGRANKFLELVRQPPSEQVILSFRKRLLACLQAKGGHFEKTLRCKAGR